MYCRRHKRMKVNERKDASSSSCPTSLHSESKYKKGETLQDYAHPFSLPSLKQELDCGIYGSVANAMEGLRALKKRKLNPVFAKHPSISLCSRRLDFSPQSPKCDLDSSDMLSGRITEVSKLPAKQSNHFASQDTIDEDDDCVIIGPPAVKDSSSVLKMSTVQDDLQNHSNRFVVILDSDEENGEEQIDSRPANYYPEASDSGFQLGLGGEPVETKPDNYNLEASHSEFQVGSGGEQIETIHVNYNLEASHSEFQLSSGGEQIETILANYNLEASRSEFQLGSGGEQVETKPANCNLEASHSKFQLGSGAEQIETRPANYNLETSHSEFHVGSDSGSEIRRVNHNLEASHSEVQLGPQTKSLYEQELEKGKILVTHTSTLLHEVHYNQQDTTKQETIKTACSTVPEAKQQACYKYEEVVLKKPVEEKPNKNSAEKIGKVGKVEEEQTSLLAESQTRKDRGVYVGVQDCLICEKSNHQSDSEDGLADMWREMMLSLELSKDASGECTAVDCREGEEGEECDHSFVLIEDQGYVCRVCGVIQKSIETIFDFQWIKGTKTMRTYISEVRNTKDREQTDGISGLDISQQDLAVAEITVHPRHMKMMKPHQLEGFNFLRRNLVADEPGGCILAHAPGSGKTFMIISFVQSFLAKYPNARIMVILPKGILGTWKKEFQRWQVEDLPLYDLYTSKAEKRSEQLEILKEWVDHKGILFLGYKQFTNIVCGSGTNKIAAACHDILVKVPSILVLDEGHTPRNEDTDVLNSLAKVQTPRKVVLSGTLFQNHVREVFNILNLARPKFLKLDSSKAIKRRIMSRVQISGARKQLKAGGGDSAFYELVEYTLQHDEDFKRKVTVIHDLREMTSNVLHYYKGDFLDELPGLVDFTVLLILSPKQKRQVEKLKKMDQFKRSSVGSSIYLHPELQEFSETALLGDRRYNLDEDKMDRLLTKMDIRDGVKAKFFLNILRLCESSGEKLLVFSQYLLPLQFLEKLVFKTKGWSPGKETFMISGNSTAEQREWSMERFNNSSDAKVLFGSIKACGEGISLLGASRVVILDVHLNPSVSRQAIGRAFRPGQLRKVYVYRLVAAESPEEENHNTCFRKELISKMWFEWSEYCSYKDYEMDTVDAKDTGDVFWESSLLGEDVKVLYKR